MPPIKKEPSLNEDMVRRMAALLDETGLTEIEFGDGDFLLRVVKAAPVVAPMVAPGPTAPALAVPPAAAADPKAALSDADHPGTITSPMVGVAYLSAEPGGQQFVNVGDTVETGDTLMMIEAMKVFNSIKAPRAGRVSRIMVVNGSPVEYGEPLMILE